MLKKEEEIDFDALDYFSGGVPSYIMFQMNTEGIKRIVKKTKVRDYFNSNIPEVAFIGLIAYFEAFCKDHFASIINLCPKLIQNLKECNYNVTINAGNILTIQNDIKNRLGFLLSENYNLGTAKKINSLYFCIFKISPFSKKERSKFAQILDERNLIVHHGGIYTTKYAKQHLTKKKISNKNAFYNSLTITKRYFFETADFLDNIAYKIMKSSINALKSYKRKNKIRFSLEQRNVLDYISWEF